MDGRIHEGASMIKTYCDICNKEMRYDSVILRGLEDVCKLCDSKIENYILQLKKEARK